MLALKDPCSGLKATKVQLRRLEDDFKSKLIEEAILRTDVDRMQEETRAVEEDALEAVSLAEELQRKIDEILDNQAEVISIYFFNMRDFKLPRGDRALNIYHR